MKRSVAIETRKVFIFGAQFFNVFGKVADNRISITTSVWTLHKLGEILFDFQHYLRTWKMRA